MTLHFSVKLIKLTFRGYKRKELELIGFVDLNLT